MALFELSLFAGGGGSILGGILSGRRCVGAVEIECYPRDCLLQRQRDGILPWFPIWDDIRNFSIKNSECSEYFEWLKSIAEELCISGGFPCQDISCAGKGAGITGARSGLWKEFARVIREIRPRNVLVENSPMLIRRGIGDVLGDLAEMGYNAKHGVVSAADAIWIGGPPVFDHLRERIWIYATADSYGERLEKRRPSIAIPAQQPPLNCVIKRLPTVTEDGNYNRKGASETSGDGLATAIQRLPTARSCNAMSAVFTEKTAKRKRQNGEGQNLEDVIARGGEFTGLSLNPEWLEWYQGWPLGWTSLEPMEKVEFYRWFSEMQISAENPWWSREPRARVCGKMKHRKQRIAALGNGQVPRCVWLAEQFLA